jgi:hypothetical protein
VWGVDYKCSTRHLTVPVASSGATMPRRPRHNLSMFPTSSSTNTDLRAGVFTSATFRPA